MSQYDEERAFALSGQHVQDRLEALETITWHAEAVAFSELTTNEELRKQRDTLVSALRILGATDEEIDTVTGDWSRYGKGTTDDD